MWGAIIGDIVGSRYEFNNILKKDFPLISRDFSSLSIVTDDSICTAAIADAIQNGKPFEDSLRQWCKQFPHAGYGPLFWDWINDSMMGPYNSWGNGSAMRTSPCALLASSDHQAIQWAKEQAAVSHNHPNGIHGAMAITHAIRLAFSGQNPTHIRQRMQIQWGYDLHHNMESLRNELHGVFDVSCGGTVRSALICALEAVSFEDAIRNAVSLGGDCDTTAAVTGPLAEAMFGIPQQIIADVKNEIVPLNIQNVIENMYHDARSQITMSGKIISDFNEIVGYKDQWILWTGDHKIMKETMKLKEKPSEEPIISWRKEIIEEVKTEEPGVLDRFKKYFGIHK